MLLFRFQLSDKDALFFRNKFLKNKEYLEPTFEVIQKV